MPSCALRTSIARPLEVEADQVGDVLFVLDDQNSLHFVGEDSGRLPGQERAAM